MIMKIEIQKANFYRSFHQAESSMCKSPTKLKKKSPASLSLRDTSESNPMSRSTRREGGNRKKPSPFIDNCSHAEL